MNIESEQIRSYRLHVHHLDRKIPMDRLADAAGACGLQNSPPGAWETALYNRLEGCTLQSLQDALYKEKSLLQAWSFRGAPVVFPTDESDVFLSALTAQDGEQPWIYTLGITGALDFLQLPFDDLLQRTKKAAAYLDHHTVRSKEALDQTLADIIQEELPKEKRDLWNAPSMYGRPDRQTVGGAAVSFLLRPCSFSSLVVFGERQGISPTFTSYRNWIGRAPGEPAGGSTDGPTGEPTGEPAAGLADAGKALTRKFLHCYGPATLDSFTSWLGCSRRQAHRLWDAVADELEPVTAEGKTRYMPAADMNGLLSAGKCEECLVLLGAHDPYLDIRDRTVILDDKSLHTTVWKTVGNPGAILKGGRVAGIWKTKTQNGKLDISMTLFEALTPSEQKTLRELSEEYAAFRGLNLSRCSVENIK